MMITWDGESNGTCNFSNSLLITDSQSTVVYNSAGPVGTLPFGSVIWPVTSLIGCSQQKYELTTAGYLYVATTWTGHAETYTYTWTTIDTSNPSNTVAVSITVAVIDANMACTPNLTKTGSLSGTYNYNVGDADLDLQIPTVTNGNCKACTIVHLNDVLA